MALKIKTKTGTVLTVRGAIFDMDGTLIDSMPLWKNAGRLYLEEHGKNPPADLYKILKEMTMHEMADYFISNYGFAMTNEEMIRDVNSTVEKRYITDIPEKKGAAAFVQLLHECGVRIYVATATERPLSQAALCRLGIWEHIEGLITCSEAGEGKNSPLIYHLAAERLGTKPEETLVFEDALHCVRTAAAAGYPVAAVRDESTANEWDQICDLADCRVDAWSEAAAALFA